MRRKSLVYAASWAVLLLVLPGSAATAENRGQAATAGTSYVFDVFANAPQAQGIAVLRGDEGAGTALANLYFRKLAPSSPYRISVNATPCGSTTAPTTHTTAFFKVTSDAKGEVYKAGGPALGEVPAAWDDGSLSIWEGWAGTTRRFCKNGFDISVAGPDQAVGSCSWLGVAHSQLISGSYAGNCGEYEVDGSDGFLFSVPTASHQYRVTINGHPCSQNLPNQQVFNGFKVTSNATARIFSKETPVDGQPGSDFSVSIYDGWASLNRVACMKGTNFYGNP